MKGDSRRKLPMSRKSQTVLRTALVVLTAILSGLANAQNSAPNPYRTIENWAELPDGRVWGSTSAIYPTNDGMHIWVAERCGTNLCVGSDVDPVLLYDLDGNLIKSFGAGLITWPHGMYVDADDNVWVADAVGYAPVPEGIGHTIMKFSPDGELLMRLGKEGVAGNGTDVFNKPSDMLVAPDGSIFVVDGHDAGGNNRVMKFDKDGNFILQWGKTGKEDGEFRDPHALAMDSQGRLFVGDRTNSRLQIFTQDGEHIATWTQFGRPSGLFIDKNDILYSADSESNAGSNGGWKRGIRIGSAIDGFVTAFIPDPEPDQDNSGTSAAEGVAVDKDGNIYGAEVGPRAVRKYIKK
jgi:DNA-binding beta-propeller fold protein YncE